MTADEERKRVAGRSAVIDRRDRRQAAAAPKPTERVQATLFS
jgi:hypothetical protein